MQYRNAYKGRKMIKNMGWKKTLGCLATIGIVGGGSSMYYATQGPDTNMKLGVAGFIALASIGGAIYMLTPSRRNNSPDLTQRLQNTPQNQSPNSNPNTPNVHITYNDHSTHYHDNRSVHTYPNPNNPRHRQLPPGP